MKTNNTIGLTHHFPDVERDDSAAMVPNLMINNEKSIIADGKDLVALCLAKATRELDNAADSTIESFWEIKQEGKKPPQIKIWQHKFTEFLENSGYYQHDRGKSKVYVQVRGNKVREISPDYIKGFIRQHIKGLPEQLHPDYNFTNNDLLEKVYNSSSTILGDGQLMFLSDIEPKFLKDTKDAGYFFFTNCYVKVTVEACQVLDYSQMEGYVWEDQILDREYHPPKGNVIGDYEKIIIHVSNAEQERVFALMSSIGYLVHSFKDPSLTKAIIFMDEKISSGDEANGGTCKSLVAVGLSKIKNTWYRGKDIKLDKAHAYQGITPATQLCLLDDLPPSFKFEYLFTNITNSLTVEGKYQPAFTIKFADAPKWLITTNYTILGEGSSFNRRRHVVEFSDYYNENPPPIEEFNRRLFDEWPSEEWNHFDSFIFRCLQHFLANGLQEVKINFDERKLIESTSSAFVQFMEGLPVNIDFDVHRLLREFCPSDQGFQLPMSTFCKWIRLYLEARNITTQGDIKKARQKPLESRNGGMYLMMLANTPD